MWIIYALLAMLAWGFYSIPGNKATDVHGEKVSLVFEAVAFVILCLVVSVKASNDFSKVTWLSAKDAATMGLLSAGGFYFMLKAMGNSPQNLIPVVVIAGCYPMVTAVAGHLLGHPLSVHQWLSVGVVMTGLVMLVGWK